MIKISELPLIVSAEQFHAARQILLVDVLYVGDAPRAMREYIKNTHGGFVYEKKTYMPITLTGNPESLIVNAEKGIHFKFDKGFQNFYQLDGNLDAAIWHKKLYDLSAFADHGAISFDREEAFVIDRYLANYREFPNAPTKLLEIPQKMPSIGVKAMKGLKFVGK